jgi:hypothetical protein
MYDPHPKLSVLYERLFNEKSKVGHSPLNRIIIASLMKRAGVVHLE